MVGDGEPSRARALAWAWLPTAFGASMLVIEIPAVYAAVTRADDGARMLAGLGVAVAVLTIVNTPALAHTPLVVAEAGRSSQRRLWRYAVGVGLAGALLLLTLAIAPPLATVLELVVGDANRDLVAAARAGLLGLTPNSLAVAMRRYLQGRLIHAARTSAIMTATFVRIGGTALVAWVGVALFDEHGALVGGVALSVGAFIEAALLALATRALPSIDGRDDGGVASLAREHARLSTAQLLNMAPMLVTTVGIAHAARPTASLIVWPALYQLASLFSSPTSDWQSVAAAALRERPTDPAPRRVTFWLSVAFLTAFALVVVAGGGDAFLRGFVDVPDGPAELGLRWLPWLLPTPALWVVRGYLRGRAMSDLRTGWLVWAGVVHLGALLVTLAVLGRTTIPGVGVACLAILCGLVADIAVTRPASAASCRALEQPA